MKILGLDLAANSSAYMLMGGTGAKILASGDSYGSSDQDFVNRVIGTAGMKEADWILVEDLPYHVPYRLSVKDVLRMQGRLISEAERWGIADKLLFVTPSVWQQSYNGVFRGKAAGAQAAALEHGYEMPNLLVEDARFDLTGLSGKPRTKKREAAKKLSTDYVDAWLITRWGLDVGTHSHLADVKGVAVVRSGPPSFEAVDDGGLRTDPADTPTQLPGVSELRSS